MSQDNNFLDEFNNIVSQYYISDSNNVNISKSSRIFKTLLVGVFFLSGLFLIVLSVAFVFILLAIIGFFVMVWSSLQIWKMFTNSTYFDKIITRYSLYRMYLRELDRRRFGSPPEGRNRRVEDEFWSF